MSRVCDDLALKPRFSQGGKVVILDKMVKDYRKKKVGELQTKLAVRPETNKVKMIGVGFPVDQD